MKSGFVAIVGRPGVGKSTFLNQILQAKVSIVSAVPQTTRRPIKGIYNSADSQIIFLDTPGFHHSERKFNQKLIEQIERSQKESDVVLYITDLTRALGSEEKEIMQLLTKQEKQKIVVFINKADVVNDEEKILAKKDEIKEYLPQVADSEIFYGSALENIGLVNLLDKLSNELPEGPAFYPPDFYTDQPFDLRVTEIVREKVFQYTKEEIPHSCYCELADFEEKPEKNLLILTIYIILDRESQKGIVLGAGGRLIKKISTESRQELEEILDKKIYLNLKVKVRKKWRKDDRIIKKMFR